jgi:hypothetical protein
MSTGVRGPYAHLVKLRAILKTIIPQNAAVKYSCETEKYGHAVPSSKSHDGNTKTRSRSDVLRLRFRSGSALNARPQHYHTSEREVRSPGAQESVF